MNATTLNTATATTKKNKGMVSAKVKLVTPVTASPSPFAALVANQQKTASVAVVKTAAVVVATNMANTGVAVQQAAKEGFTRTVQNGRGDYTPNSIGALIWQTATALQALTPNTPIQASAVRLALPHVKPASVSAGLSHWRKFCGTMRVKGVVRAPVLAAPVLVGPIQPNNGAVLALPTPGAATPYKMAT